MRKLVVAVTFVALAAAGPAPAKRDRGPCERAQSKTIAELSRAGAVAWVEDDEVHLLNSAGHQVVATDVQDVSRFRIGVDVLRWADSAGEHSVPAGEY